MISVRALTKTYGSLMAVDGLDLDIPQGEFFAFLGPNAAGKTTTIKMLTGLLRPTAGEVKIGGFRHGARARKRPRRCSPMCPIFPSSTTSLPPRNSCSL